MIEDDDLIGGLNEIQQIVLEKVKKDISGLSVRDAKEVLYKALSEIEDESIVSRLS